MWEGYFYAEALNITTAQKDTLVDALKAWGEHNDHNLPHHRIHWRVRTDNNAVIFEADFNEDNLTPVWFRNKLAQIFNVDPSTITFSTNQTQYGPVVTFVRGGQNRLRFGLFGGLSATYLQSQSAVLSYLKDNAIAWGEI